MAPKNGGGELQLSESGTPKQANNRISAFFELVSDEAFASCWRKVNKRFITRDEFLVLPMPSNIEAGDLWRLIRHLRRQMSSSVPYPRTPELWYCLPALDRESVGRLVSRGGVTSALGSYLAEHDFRTMDTESQIKELVEILRKDGMNLEYEDIRAIYMEERKPRSDEERIVANFTAILAKEMASDGNAGRECSVPEIYKELTSQISSIPDKPLLPSACHQLSKSMALASRTSADTALCLSAHLAEVPPAYGLFAAANATMGTLLRKLFLIRSGIGVLAILPMGYDIASRGRFGEQPFSDEDCLGEDGGDYDLTGYFHSHFERLHPLLDRLEAKVLQLMDRENELLSIVSNTPVLNHRQKALLVRGLKGRGETVTPSRYGLEYGVTTRTASTDLAHLASLGLIVPMRMNQGQLAYGPSSSLRKLIGELPLDSSKVD